MVLIRKIPGVSTGSTLMAVLHNSFIRNMLLKNLQTRLSPKPYKFHLRNDASNTLVVSYHCWKAVTAEKLSNMSISVCGSYWQDRKSTRLNSSHVATSYAVFCLKKKNYRKYEHNEKFLNNERIDIR